MPAIDRPGFISAWNDPAFVAAIEKTGRKNLIMAGVTIDVCLAFAAMQAVDAAYNVYGVVDASGALEVTIRENAVARMKDHGITLINWTTVAAELQRNWTLPTGQELGRVAGYHVLKPPGLRAPPRRGRFVMCALVVFSLCGT